MFQLPVTIAEYVADFAGIASGFALSPRNIALGVIALLLGIFRLSAAWALLVGAFAALSHLYILSSAGRYIDMTREYAAYSQTLTLGTAILVSLLWYVLGRIVRSLKSPMLTPSDIAVPQPQHMVTEIESRAAPVSAGIEGAQPLPSDRAKRSGRMDHPSITAVLGGLFLLVVLGFGIQVHRLPPPETPVLFGYVKQPGQGLVWRYATVECVRNGQSLEGYVWNRLEMMRPVNVFDLQPEISIGSLGQARALARKMREMRDADPICSQAEGFSGRGQPLIISLFE